MQNVRLERGGKLSSYRKISISSWRHPRDPSTYSSLDLPVEDAETFLKEYASSTPATLTHFVAKILAHCYERSPAFNHFLRMGNLQKRREVDIFITTLVRTDQGKDLSGFIIRDVASKTMGEVARICQERVDLLRKGIDPDLKYIQGMAKRMPSWMLVWALNLQDFLQHTLNLNLSWFGLPRDPFGSVTISNIGALGLDNAYIPLSPYTRASSIIGIGKPREIPIVKDHEVVPGKCVTISFTFDHRYADGAHGAEVLRRFKKIFTNPAAYPQVFEAE